MTIDWANPAVEIKKADELTGIAISEAKYKTGEYDFSARFFDEIEEELIEHLVRTGKYSVLYNANFGLYSEPSEDREAFLARIAESGLEKVEPEIKRLLGRFELAIEQLREAQSRRGRKLEGKKAEEAFAFWRDIFHPRKRVSPICSSVNLKWFWKAHYLTEQDQEKTAIRNYWMNSAALKRTPKKP